MTNEALEAAAKRAEEWTPEDGICVLLWISRKVTNNENLSEIAINEKHYDKDEWLKYG